MHNAYKHFKKVVLVNNFTPPTNTHGQGETWHLGFQLNVHAGRSDDATAKIIMSDRACSRFRNIVMRTVGTDYSCRRQRRRRRRLIAIRTGRGT